MCAGASRLAASRPGGLRAPCSSSDAVSESYAWPRAVHQDQADAREGVVVQLADRRAYEVAPIEQLAVERYALPPGCTVELRRSPRLVLSQRSAREASLCLENGVRDQGDKGKPAVIVSKAVTNAASNAVTEAVQMRVNCGSSDKLVAADAWPVDATAGRLGGGLFYDSSRAASVPARSSAARST